MKENSEGMLDETWFAYVFGPTVAQSAFYEVLFKTLMNEYRFYPRDINGWSRRSMSYWLARLADGDKERVGLNVLTHHREGNAGPHYYKWSPHFLFRLYSLYRKLKRRI